MQRKVGHVLHDMLQAIERMETITHGKTLEDFSTDCNCNGWHSGRLKSFRKQAAPYLTR